MLSRRTLELRPGTAGLPQALISHQHLIDCGQISERLAQAHAQANKILNEAQAAAQALQKKAHDEFWQQANSQLAHWQQKHRDACYAMESNVSEVVNLALLQLLDEVPPPARINTLLAKLMLAQCPPLDAILRCHPQALESVRQWLGDRPDSLWQLQTDECLDPHALVLVTAQHDLRIDWTTTVAALLIPAPTDGTDPPTPATDA